MQKSICKTGLTLGVMCLLAFRLYFDLTLININYHDYLANPLLSALVLKVFTELLTADLDVDIWCIVVVVCVCMQTSVNPCVMCK